MGLHRRVNLVPSDGAKRGGLTPIFPPRSGIKLMSKASQRVKLWRKANPEKYRAQRRAYHVKNRSKELARSRAYKQSERGRETRRLSRERNRERENELANIAKKKSLRKDARRFLVNSARHRAKKKNVNFSISIADLVVPATCPLLGIPLSISDGVLSDNSPTLDRIVNSVGYVPGNIIVVSYRANRAKGSLSSAELFKLATNLQKLGG